MFDVTRDFSIFHDAAPRPPKYPMNAGAGAVPRGGRMGESGFEQETGLVIARLAWPRAAAGTPEGPLPWRYLPGESQVRDP